MSDWEGFGGNFTPSTGEAERTRANREARRLQELRMEEAAEWEGFGMQTTPSLYEAYLFQGRQGEAKAIMRLKEKGAFDPISFKALSQGEQEPSAWDSSPHQVLEQTGSIMTEGVSMSPETPNA